MEFGRRGIGFWLIVLTTAVVLALCARFGWILSDPGLDSSAQAQGAGEQQYLAPEQVGDGTVTFSGASGPTYETEPFSVTSDTITITSESNPQGYSPTVEMETADGNSLVEAQEDYQEDRTTYTAGNIDPGDYRLRMFTSTPANVDATFSVVLTEGDAPGAAPTAPDDQYDDQYETTTAPAPVPAPAPVEDDDGQLMEAGGPEDGPVPAMPSGECPKEFPVEEAGGCWR